MNSRFFSTAVVSILFVFFATGAFAQARGGPDPSPPPTGGPPQVTFNPGQPGGISIYGHEGSALVLTVRGDRKELLDRQAVVKLTNKSNPNVLWQTTEDGSVAVFTELRVGLYDVEVSAVGYLMAHEGLTVQGINTTHQMEVVLEKDPSAVDLSIQKGLEIPSKARKNLVRGADALKSGKLQDAQKHLDAAYSSFPYSSEASFLLGYLYFLKSGSKQGQAYLSDILQAKTYLAKAVTLDPHNVQALSLLGRLYIQESDYTAARTTLEQAVAADPDYWTAHHLLGNVYLRQNEFEKARAQAELAIERGKGGGSAAELVLGEALANLGRDQEAIQALQRFVQGTPASTTAPQVRELISDLQRRDSNPASKSQTAINSSSIAGPDAMLAAAPAGLSINTWQPAGIDDVKPAVAADASCPFEKVIDGAGQRVKEFVDSLAQFDAIEDLTHEELDPLGNPKKSVSLKFDYVASISESQPGRFIVDEFRSGRSGTEDFPDQIATRGLPTLALIFHPDMRDNFDMTCEGLGTWNGKATWLVHFRQREDHPHRIQDYIVANRVYPVSMKGRAWIAADSFQIVRLESEMVSPIPEIQLVSQHQIVEYASVPFPKKNVELWLPKNADLYFDFRRHHYFRRHSFDHFMLFSVDMEEKRKEPKQKAESDGPSSTFFQKRLKHHKARG